MIVRLKVLQHRYRNRQARYFNSMIVRLKVFLRKMPQNRPKQGFNSMIVRLKELDIEPYYEEADVSIL